MSAQFELVFLEALEDLREGRAEPIERYLELVPKSERAQLADLLAMYFASRRTPASREVNARSYERVLGAIDRLTLITVNFGAALLPSVRRYEEAAAAAIVEAADRIASRVAAEWEDSLPPGARVVFDHTPLTEGAPMPEPMYGTEYRGRDLEAPASGYSRLQIELDKLEESMNLLLDRCSPLLIEERSDPTAELVERAPASGLASLAYKVGHLRRRLDDISSRLDV